VNFVCHLVKEVSMPAVIRRCVCALPILIVAALVVITAQTRQKPAWAPGSSPTAGTPDWNTPQTIEPLDTVHLEEMNWIEARDAIKGGKKTVIIAAAGIEQSGPYAAGQKHCLIIHAVADSIARKLGDALVAPILTLVPEGDPENLPAGRHWYPNTVGVSVETFKSEIRDVAAAMKASGFEKVVLIADHGSEPKPMQEVADELTKKWGGSPQIKYIAEHYDYAGVSKFAEQQLKIDEYDEGLHDNYVLTAMMMAADPNSVRTRQRIKAGKFKVNGVDLAPESKTIANGKKCIDFMANRAVAAIKKAFNPTGAH
jgi:creatinine amidohydrolase